MPLYLIRAGNAARICYRQMPEKLNLKLMQAHNPEELTVVAQRDHWGKNAAEALGERFARLHIHGEWYVWDDEIAEAMKETIQRRVSEVTPRKTYKNARNEAIIERLLSTDSNMADVAKDYGITRERVRQIARDSYGATARSLGIIERKGVKRRAKERAAAKNRAERESDKDKLLRDILELRDQGLSQVKIANKLGIAQSRVSTLLIAAGRRTR